jgi:hypothetical protein
MERRLALGAIAVLVLAVAGCGGSQSTPQEAASGYRAAMADRDWERAFGYLTRNAQAEMVGWVYVTGAYRSQADPALAKSFSKLARKYGFDRDGAALEEAGNLAEIFGELVDWIEDNLPDPFDPAERMATTEFSEFEIDGDRARAKMLSRGRTRRVGFTKIHGRWFLDG